MTRDAAIARARGTIADGGFAARLARRVAIPSASRVVVHAPDLTRYLTEEMIPAFEAMGFTCRLLHHRLAPGPCLLAERIEDPSLPTILQYGHGDVVAGLTGWHDGLDPFTLTERDGKWFGRGTADNKGQHSINMEALAALLAVRGRLGFNLKYLIEMGEESGSLGLAEICAEHREALKADLFLASDGPRMDLTTPTLFLGARGGVSFYVEIRARDAFQHSGNWGGLISNPAIELLHAITSLVDRKGRILVPELTPGSIPDNVRATVAKLHLHPEPGDPAIEEDWGEPGLTPPEQVYCWSSFDVMEMECGNLAQPLYAIPPMARARLQLRFPVGVDVTQVVPAVRRALAAAGHDRVVVHDPHDAIFLATRLDPDHPLVRRAAASLAATTGAEPAILPNIGGSLPNSIFALDLGLPTIWIPHSYPGCLQHAANEHLPVALAQEALGLMAGLYWDMGDPEFWT